MPVGAAAHVENPIHQAAAVAPPAPARVVIVDLRGSQAGAQGSGGWTVVCGLPIVVRNLLVLDRAGWQRAVLLLSPQQRANAQALLARRPTPRLTVTMKEDEGETLAGLAETLAEGPEGAQVLYLAGALSLGRRAPELADASPQTPQVGCDPTTGRALGLVLATAGRWRHLLTLPAAALSAHLLATGDGTRVSLPDSAVTVSDRASAKQAEGALLRSLRKDADGVVARVDRNVSLAISRRLMALPVRPNHVTGFAALLGLACGLVTAHGGYWFMLVGALALEFNAIFDGVDGEIARAKLLESRRGQWLDTLADDFSNLSFMLGAAVGSYRTWGSPVYLVLGGIAGTSFLVTTAIMYHYLITRARSGDLNDFVMPWQAKSQQQRLDAATAQPGLGRLLGSVQWLFRRDAYVFLCTLLALAGQLRFMVWLFALGTTATWLAIVLYRWRRVPARALESQRP